MHSCLRAYIQPYIQMLKWMGGWMDADIHTYIQYIQFCNIMKIITEIIYNVTEVIMEVML